MSRVNISSGSAFEAQIGYSRAVVLDDGWIMVSGTTGYSRLSAHILRHLILTIDRYDYDTGRISEDVAEQTEQIFLNIDKALQEAGSSMADIVRVNYILPDREDFPKTWPVLQKWFGDVRPAAMMLQAPLMKEEMKIELEVTAKKGSGRK